MKVINNSSLKTFTGDYLDERLQQVTIYTDGSCLGNGTDNSLGGYCAIIWYKDYKNRQYVKGSEKNTTNSRMELRAIIEALKSLKESNNYMILLYTDSQYIVKAINEKWIDNWIKKNWKKSDNKPVANQDLWTEYIKYSQRHQIKLKWIKAHSDDYWNEECDTIAKEEAEKLKDTIND